MHISQYINLLTMYVQMVPYDTNFSTLSYTVSSKCYKYIAQRSTFMALQIVIPVILDHQLLFYLRIF